MLPQRIKYTYQVINRYRATHPKFTGIKLNQELNQNVVGLR